MKVLAIASVGGHWIQLLRLRPAFDKVELEFMSTRSSFASMVPNHKFYTVPDASRWNKFKLLVCFYNIFSIISKSQPDLIVTTGAAPGLMGVIAGRMLGIKTVWVDSIANVDQISLSGRIASRIATKVYTQWPGLANEKIVYKGSVL